MGARAIMHGGSLAFIERPMGHETLRAHRRRVRPGDRLGGRRGGRERQGRSHKSSARNRARGKGAIRGG